jgi:hypothetical protein
MGLPCPVIGTWRCRKRRELSHIVHLSAQGIALDSTILTPSACPLKVKPLRLERFQKATFCRRSTVCRPCQDWFVLVVVSMGLEDVKKIA